MLIRRCELLPKHKDNLNLGVSSIDKESLFFYDDISGMVLLAIMGYGAKSIANPIKYIDVTDHTLFTIHKGL